MPDQSSDVRLTTGQVSFEGGVDSGRVTTIASPNFPSGIAPTMCAWLNNATVRGGGITPRYGYKPLVESGPWSGWFQGAYMYEPDNGLPYIIASIGGRIYQIRVDTDNSVVDLSALFDLTMPADQEQSFFTQGEQFLVIQAGDFTTLPLFWDGSILRRSIGASRIVGITNANFTVPAVPGTGLATNGAFVNVTLKPPGYTGAQNQIITINGKEYLQVVPDNFVTLKNLTEPGVNNTIPAATPIYDTSGNVITVLLTDSTIPATGASINTFVTTKYAGALPKNVTIIGEDWQITAVGHPPPAANHVFLVNVNDTPGATVTAPANLLSVPELPAAGPMDYYMGRIWFAVGRNYAAGDIVKGPSGTVAYDYRDSILKITENPLATSGEYFVVPTNAGNIRGLAHTAEKLETLGQGRLYVGTRKAIYRLDVPVTRDEWTDPDFADNQPKQVVVQRRFGFINDRSIVPVNGDLWYQAVDGIRSLELSVRNDQGWGDVPASKNERRAINFNDRALLHFGSGIYFDNRLLQTAVPFRTDVGVAHRGLLPLDFDLITSLESQAPPAWEGFLEGLDFLQVLEGDFGGLQRAFAFIVSRVTGGIELWELTITDFFDRQVNNDGARIERVIETPAYTWGDPFTLKQLQTMELWYDQMRGTVDFQVYLRPDNYPCWVPWHAWQVCIAKDCTEQIVDPCSPEYPNQLFCAGFESSVSLPKPPPFCIEVSKRPVDIGYQFQIRIITAGWCRIRGIRLHALPRLKEPYANLAPCPPPMTITEAAQASGGTINPPQVTPNLFEDENGSVIFDEGDGFLDLGDQQPAA